MIQSEITMQEDNQEFTEEDEVQQGWSIILDLWLTPFLACAMPVVGAVLFGGWGFLSFTLIGFLIHVLNFLL